MVQLGEISFCDRKAYNIKCDMTKKQILEKIEKQYMIKIISKKYDRFDMSMISNLNNNPHLLCVRSNGNPYYLFLTKINFVNYCIFIDKKIQQGYFYPRMILTTFGFNDSLFEDTIFDGEMIKRSDKWTFLLHDLIVCQGVHLSNQNLVKRINSLYKLLQDHFKPDDTDVSKLQVKKFFTYDEKKYFIDTHIPELNYSCRGIYFKPLFLRFKDILINFDDSLVKKIERFKLKKDFLLIDDLDSIHKSSSPEETPKDTPNSSECSFKLSKRNTQNTQNTQNYTQSTSYPIDEPFKVFKVKKTELPDIYHIVDNDFKFVDFICINSMRQSKYMSNLFTNKNVNDILSIKLSIHPTFHKWCPVID